MKKMRKLFAGLSIALLLSPGYGAASEYRSSSDTGAERLDFLENRRRLLRDQALTDEQKKLLEDSEDIRAHLRKPLDPTQPSPTIFEGDDLSFDQNTGEFIAKGKVHIVQMDAHQFDSEDDGVVKGNTIKQEIEIPGRAHVLQMTPDEMRITMDGYNTFYNYGERTGTMEEAVGKVDYQYVKGKRFEFYPDHVVIYDGSATKCGAKVPDYHLSADKITIWPNDKMILEEAKFWVKNTVLYTKHKYVQDISPGAQGPQFPRVGYSKSDGAWISYNYTRNLARNVDASLHLYYGTKLGARSNGELRWGNAGASYRLVYGYYEDGEADAWVKKKPSFIYKYGSRIGNTPFHYGLDFEIGRWKRKQENASDIESTHTYGRLSLSRDPIVLSGNWYLFLSGGYSITKESYDDSRVKGFDCTAAVLKEFDNRWAAYSAYEYSTSNKTNSLFAYDVNDVARALKAGFSYRFSDRDRIVYGIQYDLGGNRLKDIDYYWFHDFHCTQLVLRYRAKRDEWKVHWEFLPW